MAFDGPLLVHRVVEYSSPPILDIDEKSKAKFGRGLNERERFERAFVWNLCQHLKANGFKIVMVDDGVVKSRSTHIKSAMERIFGADSASLHVKKKGFRIHSIQFVFGSADWEVVEDYTVLVGDTDSFAAVMKLFQGKWVLEQMRSSNKLSEERQKRESLVEALRPFAALSISHLDSSEDDHPLLVIKKSKITVGDVRLAQNLVSLFEPVLPKRKNGQTS